MNNETKFTPGPWSLDNNDVRDEAQAVLRDATGCIVADAFTMGRAGECEANAHLIGAAPDGYALAELVMEICGNPKGISERDQEELYEAALQYAKKARGEA